MGGKIDGPPSSTMGVPGVTTDTEANEGGFAPYPPNKPDQTPGAKAPHMPGQVNPDVAVGK